MIPILRHQIGLKFNLSFWLEMSLSMTIRCLIKPVIQRKIFTPVVHYNFLLKSAKSHSQRSFSGAPCSEPAKPPPTQTDQPCPPPKMAKPSPTALIVIANGSEDMESVATADILRRSGVDVTIADIQGLDKVTFSNKVNIVPDTSLCEAKSRSFDAIILPGGLGGTKAMCDSAELGELLRTQEKENKLIGAICAAPTALQAHRIHFGKRITCYPSCKDQLKSEYCVSDDIVVIDGKLVTSQGPGTTCQFGLHLAAILAGKEKAEAVAKAILVTMEPAATA